MVALKPAPILSIVLTSHREIIDESDVFIDVHKAIRRMAPAPKSRVPKGKIVEEPPSYAAAPQGDLIDVDGEAQAPEGSKSSADRRRSSVEAPPPRFQMRTQNTKDSDPRVGWITQRGATDEIREHLKHLGPSNLASRPRHTRYQNVKIKRGSVSPMRSEQTDVDSQSNSDAASRQAVAGLTGGIGSGLLQSAGMDARDGVHALKLGYGTIGPSVDRSKDSTPRPTKDNFQISVPEPVDEQDERSYRQPSPQGAPASVHSGSSQSVSRLKAGSYKHPGPARSGSITEQVIDVNGVRKVVLHTTSSSEADESPTSPPPSGQQPPFQQSTNTDGADDDKKAGNTGSSAAKKKRRRKRRGGQGPKSSNEQQPLLS